MTDQLDTKVDLVLEFLHRQHYVVQRLDMPVDGEGRKILAGLIDELRRLRRNPTKMHESNLSTYLRHPNRAPLGFLAEVTVALGLDYLGFDEKFWYTPIDRLLDVLQLAFTGGVLSTVMGRQLNPHLLEVHPPTDLGLDLYPGERGPHLIPNIPEVVVKVGEALATHSTMPFDGYLRVVAFENGEYIGLNRFLGVPDKLLRLGRYEFNNLPTNGYIARTILFAFATTDFCFHRWPQGHHKMERIGEGGFLELVSELYELEAEDRSVCVKSIVTTMPQIV